MTGQEKRIRVLVGDDQIGVPNSLPQKSFLRAYSSLADFEFESGEEEFIKRAREGKYDALLIDLHWKPEDYATDYKTGFRVLESVKDYASIRILHTSADEEDRRKALGYGATDFAEKHRSKEYLAQKLKGGERE